jgi:PKD domain
MAITRVVGGVAILLVLIILGCDDGPTPPTDQFGPVRSLTLNVTPDRLPAAGPVNIELRATTDAGMRVAPDAVRLVLVNDGRETPNPVELDEDGEFAQRLYLSTSTVIRATAPGVIAERAVEVVVPPGGAPQPVPPAPPPPSPVPGPTVPPPTGPAPSVAVTLAAAPVTGTTETTFVFTATATPLNGAGQIVSFDWDEDGDGNFELLARPNPHSVVFDTAGVKTVSVRAHSVTAGATGTASAVVTVSPAVPFTVTLTATPECVLLGTPITFRAVSPNVAGRPFTHDWDFEGDGTFDPPSTASDSIVHTYENTGTRTARVRVTTTTGEEAVATRTVTVRPTSATCP